MKKNPSRSLTTVAVIALFGLLSTRLVADDPIQYGNVTGVIMGTDGKPMAAFALRLCKANPAGAGGGHGGVTGKKGKNASLENPSADGLIFNPDDDEQEPGMKVIARTVTDKEGKFKFEKIPTGSYALFGGSKSIGWIVAKARVKANETNDMGNVEIWKEGT